MPKRILIIWCSFIYAGLRVFSYFFGPSTPLQTAHAFNTIATICILGLAAWWLAKRDERGWYLIALEILLGGSGNYLEVAGLSLRTCLLGLALLAYSYQLTATNHWRMLWQQEKKPIIIFTALWAVVGLQALLGFRAHHATALVIADALPYVFLFYYFPLRELWNKPQFQTIATTALGVAIISNALFMLITLAGFSGGLLVLQDSYYHWYRDVASGKITELGPYYRLVVNEHLLLAPIMLYTFYQLLRRNQTKLFIALLIAETIILSVNLTRIYLVALVVGYLFLFTKPQWRRWLGLGTGFVLLFISIFTTLHLAASRGTSPGWELFGIRLGSIVAPASEDSSLSRLLLLPKIIEKIKSAPLLGAGLGDTVTVYSPVFQKTVTTPHFDWGYLEILAELGILGAFMWLKTIQLILWRISWCANWPPATLAALLVINITSPALFHVLGILWLVLLLQNKKIA